MTLIYDGHDLELLAMCGNPHFTFAPFDPRIEEMQSADGAKVIGSRVGAASVEFTCAVFGSASERRAKLSTIASWLDVDEPRQLVLPDTPDWYYLAVPSGGFDIEANVNPYIFEIAFTLTDPIAYGALKSATVPSGGSVSITVGGTAAAKPTITGAAAVRNSSSLVWGIRLDEGKFVHVATGSSASRQVVVNCDERTCTVTGAAALPTLDSDWLALVPGTHTLRMDAGTGAATVTWRERWY